MPRILGARCQELVQRPKIYSPTDFQVLNHPRIPDVLQDPARLRPVENSVSVQERCAFAVGFLSPGVRV